jgi:hypothetical protein
MLKKMKNPKKNDCVKAYWLSMERSTKAKWTGKRWLRFNELFGGYDPVKEIPMKWEYFSDFQ